MFMPGNTLNEKQIDENKNRYLEILSSIDREGIDDLVDWIKNSDFFKAPASSVYHANFEGGLCWHSLNVYDNIVKLSGLLFPYLDEDSMKVVALLHDLAKIDYYESYIQNKKYYNAEGKSSDNAGKFDWIQVPRISVKDSKERDYVFGEHGITSYIMASKFIKLNDDETAAIINHHMGLDNGKPRTDISEVLNRYSLATLLCLADQAATYLDENPYVITTDE